MPDYTTGGYNNMIEFSGNVSDSLGLVSLAPGAGMGSLNTPSAPNISSNELQNPTTDTAGIQEVSGGELIDSIIMAKQTFIRGGATAFGVGDGYWMGHDKSDDLYKLYFGQEDGDKMTWDGENLIVNDSKLGFQNIFGDGSDGDVVISALTTLTSDMFYDNLTINENATAEFGGVTVVGYRSVASEDFSVIRSGVGNASGTFFRSEILADNITDKYRQLFRSYATFTTSSILPGTTIVSAVFSAYVTSKDNALVQSIVLVQGDDPGSASSGDYALANFTLTALATAVDIDDISTGGYHDFTLNAAGIAAIQAAVDAGVTISLCPLMSCDFNNVAPTWSNASSRVYWEDDGDTNPPKLEITSTPSVILDTGGYRVHVKSILTVNGGMGRKGGNGVAGTDATSDGNNAGAGGAGGTLADGSVSGAVAGGAGGQGGDAGQANDFGVDGTDAAKGLAAAGAGGGTGENPGGADKAGGAAGAITGTVFNKVHSAYAAWLLHDFFPSTDELRSSAGSGGGGGGNDDAGSQAGGGGGGGATGGGLVPILAKKIVINVTGLIRANGGNGGNGGAGKSTTAGAGGGGGGGAGSGGVVLLVSSNLTNNGTIEATAGSPGIGGAGQESGVDDPLRSGGDGDAGSAGEVIQLSV